MDGQGLRFLNETTTAALLAMRPFLSRGGLQKGGVVAHEDNNAHKTMIARVRIANLCLDHLT